jgi:Protein of unknown function (DUF3096)
LSALHVHILFQPIASIVCGVVILFLPELLNYIVAIYLLFVGIIGLFS